MKLSFGNLLSMLKSFALQKYPIVLFTDPKPESVLNFSRRARGSKSLACSGFELGWIQSENRIETRLRPWKFWLVPPKYIPIWILFASFHPFFLISSIKRDRIWG